MYSFFKQKIHHPRGLTNLNRGLGQLQYTIPIVTIVIINMAPLKEILVYNSLGPYIIA